MKRLMLGLVLLILASCQNSLVQTPPATPDNISTEDIVYYPATGHTLQSPFLDYYRQHKGLERLGYPITEAINHEGWRVQYFQYGRLEVHPENQPAYFITVGWLGQLSHRTQPPLTIPPNPPTLYFSETGHSISGDFRTFFEANGNTVQFGRPLSEPFIHNGFIIQDFQSARFIWRPMLPSTARVQLEPLGENYFLSSNLSLKLLEPVSPPAQAEIYSPASFPLPQDTQVILQIETTPHPDVIRVVATFFNQGVPLEDYIPHLVWSGNTRALPPTRSTGQTHTLVNVSGLKSLEFALYDHAEQALLATVVYQTQTSLE